MTLSEIATYVCNKVGKSDPTTVQLCKDFIAARYRMIYDSQMWRESLGLYSGTANSGQLIMPLWMDRVVSVRYDALEIQAVDQNAAFQINPQAFDTMGTPVAFTTMQPVATSVPVNTPQMGGISFVSDASSDSGSILIRGSISGNSVSETAQINGIIPVDLDGDYDLITLISRSPSASTITFTISSSEISVLLPDSAGVQYVRINLLQQPKDLTKSILVLGKRKFQPMVNDLDAPEIRGIDNALIALSMSDLLERQRQYAKAQMKLQEGEAMIKIAIGLETSQGASLPRIVPWVGEPDYVVDDDQTPWYLAKG